MGVQSELELIEMVCGCLEENGKENQSKREDVRALPGVQRRSHEESEVDCREVGTGSALGAGAARAGSSGHARGCQSCTVRFTFAPVRRASPRTDTLRASGGLNGLENRSARNLLRVPGADGPPLPPKLLCRVRRPAAGSRVRLSSVTLTARFFPLRTYGG
ncbi:hypothetical protein FQA47_019523 [Oryzias melastigma]|uniref:Uncharacterized protein n=1 Tax=Oryzias melastigma TaxID=30732 RepID=A0A834C5X9_ORYME|nr:hypothetical protein FQA47_019523 [Oryzias melastigma]